MLLTVRVPAPALDIVKTLVLVVLITVNPKSQLLGLILITGSSGRAPKCNIILGRDVFRVPASVGGVVS